MDNQAAKQAAGSPDRILCVWRGHINSVSVSVCLIKLSLIKMYSLSPSLYVFVLIKM